jgi:hypothetical protein
MIHGDRVQETTTTTGTGSLTLAGATVGHLSFDDEIGEATECVYLIELASDPSVWEISKGTLTGTTLTRTLVKSSTGSLIDWAAGTKHVSQVLDATTLNGFGAVEAPLVLSSGTITASEPILDLSQTWNNSGVTFEGIKFNVTDTASAAASELLDLQVGGTSLFSVDKSGKTVIASGTAIALQFGAGSLAPQFSAPANGVLAFLYNGTTKYRATSAEFRIGSDNPLGFSSTSTASGTNDATWYRDAADTLAQRRGTNAQTSRIYNTWTDASNYERFAIRWDSNTLKLETQAGGTGTQRNLSISAAQILMPDLPTSDPAVAGALWRSGNDLKISTG